MFWILKILDLNDVFFYGNNESNVIFNMYFCDVCVYVMNGFYYFFSF